MTPEINLLPKRDRKSEKQKLVYIIMASIFSVLVIVIAVQYVLTTKNIHRLQVEQQSEEARKTELEAQLAALQAPTEADLSTSVQFIESISYPVSPLLLELLKYIPENTYVRAYQFTENTITFEVDFETIANVATYIGDLDGSVYFTDVKVEDMATFSPKNDGAEEKTTRFDEVERFANRITVTIEPTYLRNGGVIE